MTAPDPLHLRGYQLVVEGHRKNAARELADIRKQIGRIDPDDSQALAVAQSVARSLPSLIAELSALRALEEVSFLTTDPEAREA